VNTFRGADFRIQEKSKEEVHYCEGRRGFLFDAGWGVEPPVLYVPSSEIWAEVMPNWLRDRRVVVVDRLREHSGHTIAEDVHGYYRNSPEARDLRVDD
jgi:hypothetical protein